MTASAIRPPHEVLGVLKDFQRHTVEYVFRRLYRDIPHTRRFLVADEVGLGKTLVARGVIALTLDHLQRQDEVDRLDVVYVCSNGAIAQQNINRLNVTSLDNVALPTRLSLLPLYVKNLEANPVNFVSLTPGTSFDSASRTGAAPERVLLWAILEPDFPEYLRDGLVNALQCNVHRQNWRPSLREFDRSVDWDLQRRFLSALYENEDLYERLKEVCTRFQVYREDIPWRDNDLRLQVVSDLRGLMATVCVHALEPDLIILDEFQRFRDLLTGESDAAKLTRAFLNYREPSGHHARTLLLSATPYRMMSLHHEEEDHYGDFLETCRFLFDEEPGEVERLEVDLLRYRRALFSARQGSNGDHGAAAAVERARKAVEERLAKVMVRTERVPESRQRGAMLQARELASAVAPGDLAQIRVTDRIARLLGAPDVVEYWKSAPYLLNLMTDYKLKSRFKEEAEAGATLLRDPLQDADGSLLRQAWFEEYREVDPGNARLRRLLQDTVEAGLWELLWMPPSQPYVRPGGAYGRVEGEPTKALVFSTWSVVPDAIAGLCSYEAERRMVQSDGRDVTYSRLTERISNPLRFVVTREGRFSGAYSLLLFYPSPTLAALGDPLSLAQEGESLPLDPAVVRSRVAERIRRKLAEVEEELPSEPPEGEAWDSEDQSWYWRRVAHLDRYLNASQWARRAQGWERIGRGGSSTAADATGFVRHIRNFGQAFVEKAEPPTGRPPEDLLDVLTELALGSPAVCALRALHRLVPDTPLDDRSLLDGAARISQGFRTLFDLPETFLLLRAQDDIRYWQRVLQYGVEGNLQAVLDEYVHVLRESLGLVDHAPPKVVEGVAGAVADALSIRTSRVAADEIKLGDAAEGAGVRLERFHLRSRFALRFGDLKDETATTLHRADAVRMAFNSPFRPFVLASTSVGQEGLDFHLYCHAVYHWNLPSNPVDLEQREGRVHRYKGHAVRKNIAHTYGGELADTHRGSGDPWAWLFARALQERPDGVNDLVPFWIFEDGPARVERRVPLIPLSREVAKLKRLVRSLAVYRMALGQPRQEDLVELLGDGEGEGEGEAEIPSGWQISLRPPVGEMARPDESAYSTRSRTSTPGVEPGPPLYEQLEALQQQAVPRTREGYLALWTTLLRELATFDPSIELPAPTARNQIWFNFPRIRGALGYSFARYRLSMYWNVRGDDAMKARTWQRLARDREAVDAAISGELAWDRKEGRAWGSVWQQISCDHRDPAAIRRGARVVAEHLRVLTRYGSGEEWR